MQQLIPHSSICRKCAQIWYVNCARWRKHFLSIANSLFAYLHSIFGFTPETVQSLTRLVIAVLYACNRTYTMTEIGTFNERDGVTNVKNNQHPTLNAAALLQLVVFVNLDLVRFTEETNQSTYTC